jgi:hypothetical protein
LFDDGWHWTHFTGWMLEEDIVASLWSSTSWAITNRKIKWTSTRGRGILRGKIIHSCSNSLRGRNFFTKICQCMQHNLLNTLSKFENSICKNVDIKNKKRILIARFTKNRVDKTREKFLRL